MSMKKKTATRPLAAVAGLLVSLFFIHCPLFINTAEAQGWIDVTSLYIKNAGFDDSSQPNDWTWETSTGTAGIGSGNMRFYEGSFNFHQTLTGLPQGHYRLKVQTFYRDGNSDEAWNAHQNGTESLDAWIYAGETSQQAISIFSESLDYNAAGRSWTPDGQHYYPDGRDAAGIFFEEGLYWNTMEFDASGTIDIGIRCDVSNRPGNYCVADNFKLEYYSEQSTGQQSWIDITDLVLNNPRFDGNSTDDWSWNSNASSQSCEYEGMEFWNGTFNFWQDLVNLPQGSYRLSVQAYYRAGDNDEAYWKHKNGTEEITAYLYAGNNYTEIASIYSVEFDENLEGSCWSPNGRRGPWFPNRMSSGSAAFTKGAYWNTVETESDGTLRIGLINETYVGGNWCMFDNFKLEYMGDLGVAVTSVQASIADAEIMVGQQTQASATVLPANALIRNVSWTSSDEAVAVVNKNGVVTGIGKGTATITATATDGSGCTSSVTVKVIKNPATAASLIINEIMASNVDEFISPAFNFDGWVELYNPTDKPVSLGGLYVSNDANNLMLWKTPGTVGFIPANGFATLWFDSNDVNGNNAPFKLDTDGGTIYFSDEDGKLITSQSYPASKERVSYARTTDGGNTWGQAGQATPGKSNAAGAFATQQLDAPVVDQPSQLFDEPLTVKVTIPQGCTLRFTDDGTLPTLQNGGTSTDGQFFVSETSIFRFRLFADGKLPSNVTSRSYIYRDRDYMLPVVSVISDPDFLYSDEIGVMVKGSNGRPGNGQSSNCNWNMNWERPVNFSYLDADGEMVLNQDVDLEMCGGWSRAWTPHSFKLKGTKEQGGVKYLPYQFFGQKPYIRNRTLQIRNGGNDNGGRFKDPSLQYIIETSGINIESQSYQPVHEFINGEYIGVLNVREPNNKHYVYSNYGWDDDEIDQFEMSPDSGYVQKCGTPDAFLHLVDDLSPNAADANTYAEIQELLDIDEYVNYMAIEFFLGSTDWPRNNVKGFRHRNGGKFRLVLYDLDGAFETSDPFRSFFDKEWWEFDQLYPTSLGRIYDQIRLVTLFKNLLANDTFRKKFIDAYCIVLGSVFEMNRVNDIIDQLLAVAEPAMNLNWESSQGSAESVRNNLSYRLSKGIGYLRKCELLQVDGLTEQQVNLSSNVSGARLMINGRDVPTGRFDGMLFSPIVLRAVAPEGYTFKGWKNSNGTLVNSNAEYDISGKGDQQLTATYEPIATDENLIAALAMPIKVNEVSAGNTIYCNDYFKRNDWFELYNNTDTDLNLAGLYVSDDVGNPMKYQITAQGGSAALTLPAGGHRIVWADELEGMSQLHANFQLSNSSNQVVIICSSDEFVNNNSEYFQQHPGLKSFIDGMLYSSHSGVQSVGRYPDGGSTFYQMNRPTIERTNTIVGDDQTVGTDQNWMELATHNFTLQLAEGWNWTSHLLATPFAPGKLPSQVERIVSQTQEAYRDQKLGMTGTLKQMEAGQLYKIQTKGAATFTSTDAFCNSDMPIALRPGWNWVGYTVNGAQSLSNAFAPGFTPESGDMIVGQNGLSTYGTSGWTGSLNTLETGMGYMYKSKSTKTLRFKSPTQAAVRMNRTPALMAALSATPSSSFPAPSRSAGHAAALPQSPVVNPHAYPNILGIIARPMLDGQPVESESITLLAYADNECRGIGKWADGLVWMNVFGDGGEAISYWAIDQTDGTVYAVKETSVFTSEVEGTYESPLLLTLTDGSADQTGISSFALNPSPNPQHPSSILGYYSLGGTLVARHAASLRPGVYIIRYSNGSCRKICIE